MRRGVEALRSAHLDVVRPSPLCCRGTVRRSLHDHDSGAYTRFRWAEHVSPSYRQHTSHRPRGTLLSDVCFVAGHVCLGTASDATVRPAECVCRRPLASDHAAADFYTRTPPVKNVSTKGKILALCSSTSRCLHTNTSGEERQHQREGTRIMPKYTQAYFIQ